MSSRKQSNDYTLEEQERLVGCSGLALEGRKDEREGHEVDHACGEFGRVRPAERLEHLCKLCRVVHVLFVQIICVRQKIS